jgi:hypothetical protein
VNDAGEAGLKLTNSIEHTIYVTLSDLDKIAVRLDVVVYQVDDASATWRESGQIQKVRGRTPGIATMLTLSAPPKGVVACFRISRFLI